MEWRIRSGEHEAVVVETGGGLRTYDVSGRPLLDGYAADEPAPGGAGQVLAPWPNRIRDGRYSYAGRTHQLPLTEPEHHNAIHGLVRREPWQLVDAAEDRVTVEYTVEEQPGYPFSLRLTTTWSISGAGLRAEHTATGLGAEPAPFGLGIHPYLLISGVPADDLTLTVPATRVLLADDRGLPTELLAVEGTDWDFRRGRRIGSQLVDQAFTGLTERTVRLTNTDRSVQLWLGEGFGWVQVFTGDTLTHERRRRAVAVEPMTCPSDAFNSGTDLIALPRGESWRGMWGIQPA